METIRDLAGTIVGFAIYAALVALTFGSWIQHFITSVSEELWVLMVLGAVIPPVGMVHGILVWLGVL